MKAFRRTLLVSTCLVSVTLAIARTESDQSNESLIALAHKLHCADNAQSAESAIRDIQNHKRFSPGLPYESNDIPDPLLRAASLDRLLSVLYTSSITYPEHKDFIEQTVISWNFCSIVDNGTVYDIAYRNGKHTRTRSPGSFSDWLGFRQFGLIAGNKNTNVFDYQTPYKNSIIRSLADRRQQRRYINHCLPHADDEHLYRSFGKYSISRVIPLESTPQDSIDDGWRHECPGKELHFTKNEDSQKEVAALYTAPASHPITSQIDSRAGSPIAIAAAIDAVPEESKIKHPGTEDHHIAITMPVPKPVPKPVTVALEKITVPETGIPVEFDPVTLNVATIPEVERPAPVVITHPATGSVVSTTNINNSNGLSGSISLENRSLRSRDTSVKLAVSYSPKRDSYWFVRSALNISQQSNPFTYSWGFGYDDWHPGTWGAQLNHWGPLQFGDGLDLDNAVAEVSYKFHSSWLTQHNLASSIALAKPLSDKPVLSWGWSWNPHTDWFIRSTLNKPLDSGDLNWSYGFGFTRYTHSSVSFEYNNWGLNAFPKTNFRKNGQLSLIYRWQR